MGVLTYGDVTLQQSDVDLILPPNWLNDAVIAFYFELLAATEGESLSEHALYVSPASVFLMSFSEHPAELAPFLEPLALHTKDILYIPVNDNTDVTKAAGGSHWSLLLYEKLSESKGVFRHFDSFGGSNARAAGNVATKLAYFVGVSEWEVVEEADAPQQTNCHDCGAYVLAVAQAHTRAAVTLKTSGEGTVTPVNVDTSGVTPDYVKELRSDLAATVESMREDK